MTTLHNAVPTPKDVMRRHATAEANKKLALDALKLRSVREARKVVFTSESGVDRDAQEA